MASKGGGAKWLKYGCFGCLGVVLFIAIIIAIITGVAWNKAQSQEVQDQVVSRELPADGGQSPELAEGRSPEPAEGQSPEPAEDPAEPPATTRNLNLPAAAGRVILELSNAEFQIEPADPGESLRIEATYDAKSYTLEEGFDEPIGEGQAWTYRARFYRTSNPVMAFLAQILGGTRPELTVYLPADVPMDLDLQLKEGGSNVELGGLWLRDTNIDFARGGFNLQFSEPLREPAGSLSMRGMMGGFNAEGIGNASPHSLDIDVRMGGMNLDLRGAWQQDSDVSLTWDMGGGSVQLPRDVVIRGVEGVDSPEPEGEVSLPTLNFKLKGKTKDMKFTSRR